MWVYIRFKQLATLSSFLYMWVNRRLNRFTIVQCAGCTRSKGNSARVLLVQRVVTALLHGAGELEGVRAGAGVPVHQPHAQTAAGQQGDAALWCLEGGSAWRRARLAHSKGGV